MQCEDVNWIHLVHGPVPQCRGRGNEPWSFGMGNRDTCHLEKDSPSSSYLVVSSRELIRFVLDMLLAPAFILMIEIILSDSLFPL